MCGLYKCPNFQVSSLKGFIIRISVEQCIRGLVSLNGVFLHDEAINLSEMYQIYKFYKHMLNLHKHVHKIVYAHIFYSINY